MVGAGLSVPVATLAPMDDLHDSPTPNPGLEDALAAVEAEVDAAAKTVAALTRELRKARSAAVVGQVRDLRRALESTRALAADVTAAVESAASSYDVDESALLSSGAYAKELLGVAETAGVAMFEDDDRLLCYPSIVRVLPADTTLEIDRKRTRGIRPSVVVDQLGKAQRAGPRFRAAPFLASLVGAYDLVVAGQGKTAGAVVRLVDVYAALTLLPGQAREYTKAEFARDLYLLDQSGVAETSGGRRLRWAASSGTRQAGVLTTVTRSGAQQRYWGVAVEEPTR